MSFTGKLKQLFGVKASVSQGFYEDLSDILVEGDFGAAQAFKVVDELEQLAKKEKITDTALLKERFAQILSDTLINADHQDQGKHTYSASLPQDTVAVILLLGVNGVGKTTTAAKLASWYQAKGIKPILAAADTFRAGAIDQLKIHGERLNIRVVAHKQGGDPAAVVYDAADAALAGGGNLVIADTAGRMHTKTALVEELKKIDRVLETKLGNSSPYYKYLVLDATTGRNALSQAEVFHEAASLDGVILTKYDSGAKGGIVFSLAQGLKLPTVFICNGESYSHIQLFDEQTFVKEFLG